MRVDLTRSTFRPHPGYSGVLIQQGRVQLDADANEATAIALHRDRATAADLVGACGVPRDSGAFRVRAAGGDLLVDPGRLYVDGVLVDAAAEPVDVTSLTADAATLAALTLDGRPLARCQWLTLEAGDARHRVRVTAVDAATRSIDFAPPLPGDDVEALAAAGPTVSRLASYTTQPHLPDPPLTAGDCPVIDLDDGVWAVYLEVWERAVTHHEDPNLLEPALGGPDTAARSQVVWQLRLERLAEDPDADVACALPPRPAPGALEARARPTEAAADDCTVPAGAGYRRLENQLYRVEIVEPGALNDARYVWSRENGSVAAAWLGSHERTLVVDSTGPDAARGFGPGDIVELTDPTHELTGTPGTFVTVERVDEAGLHLAADPPDRGDFDDHALVRRWDDPTGPRTVERPADGDGWLDLEDGVQVRFAATGRYEVGDHWLIPARTATADIDWARDADGAPIARAPDGVQRHRCVLALVRSDGGPLDVVDCRPLLPPLTDLRAGDITVHPGTCDLPAGATVQETLETLCRQRDLRHHNKHLHGWGIVCGLKVVCDDDGDRRQVIVRPGYALDCDGHDLVLDDDLAVDVLDLVDRLDEPVLDDDGDGEVCLVLERDRGGRPTVGLVRYDPEEARSDPLDGTLLADLYLRCVLPLQATLSEALGDIKDSQAALTNLLAQLGAPRMGKTIHVSRGEHERLRGIYDQVLGALRSETFCALFEGMRPFPDYPDALLRLDERLQVVVGRDHHDRLRLHPDGREAFTVGAGLDPRRPSTKLNRYDLRSGELTETVDVLAGNDVDARTGTATLADVAVSPDGRHVYVAVPSRSGNETFFRVGTVGRTIRWGELQTVCGVRLTALATSGQDSRAVWAIGANRGLFRFEDPREVPSHPEPVAEFDAFGHLLVDDQGIAYATIAAGRGYDRVARVRTRDAARQTDVALPRGSDDLTVTRAGNRTLLVSVTEQERGRKAIVAVDATSGQAIGSSAAVDATTVRLAAGGTPGERLVYAAAEDAHGLRLYELGAEGPVAAGFVPAQAGPVAVAAGREQVAVLNGLSDTLIAYPIDLLRPRPRLPLEDLAAYRQAVLEAFADLLGRVVQYLKDCLCDALLVECRECEGDERLYLGLVSVRGGDVHRVCNHSQRRYVKSFPTVARWASLVPIAPVVDRAIEIVCCAVLPDWFARLVVGDFDAVPSPEEGGPGASAAWLRALAGAAQGIDVIGRFELLSEAVRAWLRMLGDSLGGSRGRNLVTGGPSLIPLTDQPVERAEELLADQDVVIERHPYSESLERGPLRSLLGLVRAPQPGGRVRLFEEDGQVRSFEVLPPRPTQRGEAELADLTQTVESRAAELEELRTTVARLEAQQRELLLRLDGG
jgi:hypothetical protein